MSSKELSVAKNLRNAIIYFNSRILSRLLTSFDYHRDTKRIGVVKQASPVAWHNINLNETYDFELSERLLDLEELMCSIDGYFPISEKQYLSGYYYWQDLPRTLYVFGRKILSTPDSNFSPSTAKKLKRKQGKNLKLCLYKDYKIR